ncbi:uncharacterized protein LOC132162347 [Corylus avellana]|uniref:uncharacterized protein LOC132162347 n=1 Tax=Corylus avellana TaxID=13451 RepID=UPI00286C40D7|nr:uncharacterized protein LOC132162347 [Corylus avellana]
MPPKSVDRFESLGCQFSSQFLTIRKRKENLAYLLSLVQGKTESLKDYMLGFNWEKLTIESPNKETVLSALMNGIRTEGPLMDELARRPTLATLWQFMNKVEEFINQEETIGALMKSKAEVGQGEASNSKVVLGSSGKKRKEEKSPKTSGKKVEQLCQQGQRLTSLNTSVTEVFMEIKRDPNFKWPKKMRTPLQRRSNQKFCIYHNDHNHLTKDCISLCHEIENFIKNSKLVRFLADERERSRNPQEPLWLEANHEGLKKGRDQRRIRDEPKRDRDENQHPRNQDVIGEIHTIS